MSQRERTRWRTENDGTTAWHGQWRFWRLQVGYHIYRHSGNLPDRWSIQPFIIYDRKT